MLIILNRDPRLGPDDLTNTTTVFYVSSLFFRSSRSLISLPIFCGLSNVRVPLQKGVTD